MGHEVVCLQEDEIPTSHILKLARFADLFMYTRTWKLQGDGIELLFGLERQGVPTVSYHLDLYMGISRESGVQNDPFWKTKYVFTPDGDPESAEKFKALGINHFWMPPAVVKDECLLKGKVRKEFEHDVIFVGSYDYHPEWSYRPKLIDWLHKEYGDRFKRYGNPAKDEPHAFVVREQDLSDLYASAKVVVGDSLCMSFKHKGYWSDRVPETLGRGGFLIHPNISGMTETGIHSGIHYRDYEFDNFKQLKYWINHYVRVKKERDKISQAGQKLVIEQHTYHNRMQKMFDILAKTEPKIRSALK